MTFITCSLLDGEGADQIDAFLARHRDWRSAAIDLSAGRARRKGWRLTPGHDGTDGFFFANLCRA
jgi:16S rRNA (cytosine967-C5)-methyltransferase